MKRFVQEVEYNTFIVHLLHRICTNDDEKKCNFVLQSMMNESLSMLWGDSI